MHNWRGIHEKCIPFPNSAHPTFSHLPQDRTVSFSALLFLCRSSSHLPVPPRHDCVTRVNSCPSCVDVFRMQAEQCRCPTPTCSSWICGLPRTRETQRYAPAKTNCVHLLYNAYQSLGALAVMALDSQLDGCEFDSWLPHCRVTTLC